MIEVLDREGRTVSAEDGVLGERPQLIPLVWHGEPVGRLLFGVSRPPDARMSGILARNLAELANAARLTADVARSRERILRTREEERRRLRRDLHDGLGPTLASLAMTVDAARITLKTDPEAAWSTALRDAKKHASPNAGWPEAAFAGALGLQLGGPRAYDGEIHDLPAFGDGRSDLTSSDILSALVLYWAAMNLLLGLTIVIGLALWRFV